MIKDIFLELTSKTCPTGKEEMYSSYLNKYNFSKDFYGNYFKIIGHSPNVMFNAHLDTYCTTIKNVNIVEQENFIMTDGSTILGADDKAGVSIILYMIENKIPGIYYLFVEEEYGCIGSSKVADKYSGNMTNIDCCISFDRMGYDSVITHQRGEKTCSDEFADSLAKELNKGGDFNYKKDRNGNMSDSLSFVDEIKECTNISVGYWNQHTTKEIQNISFLEKLCVKMCEIDYSKLIIQK